MRRTLAIALAALTALTLAGIAGAVLRSSGVQEVSATFNAGVDRIESRTCTGTDDKTYEIVKASYSGGAAGTDEAFNGPIVLHLKAVTNTTDGVGYVHGKLRIRRGDDNRRSWGKFWAVRKGDQIDGFVVGGVNKRYARLLGNLTADFTPTDGFANGKIGNRATGNGAAVFVGHRCKSVKPPKNSVRLVVKGAVEEKGAEHIKIKPFDGGESKTCKITGDSPKTDGIDPGDFVRAECKTSDLVLTKIREYRSKKDASGAKKSDEAKHEDKDDEKKDDEERGDD